MFTRRVAVAAAGGLLMSAVLATPASAAKPTGPPELQAERPLTPEERAAADRKLAASDAYLDAVTSQGMDLVSLSCVTPTGSTKAETQSCTVPQGYLAVEARDQTKAFYCGPATGQVISNYSWAVAPRLLAEADASERAYWLPSLRSRQLAFVDVAIGAEPSEDVRHVMLLDLDASEEAPRQLDTSGNATMPVLTDDEVVWKEPDQGFAMFNWGRLVRYSFETDQLSTVRIGPQEYVNYPSGGGRFVAMWGADAFTFAVHDLERGASRLIVSYDNEVDAIRRPHLAGDLLVWLHTRTDGRGNGPPSPIEYAWLPEPGADRGE
jgi:hypothetical protein